METSDATQGFALEVRCHLRSTPDRIYRAWTEEFDTWFAAPGHLIMSARIRTAYWFEPFHQGAYYRHYGRFLDLAPGERISQTWLSGRDGTDGAETVVSIFLEKELSGTYLRLRHSGFYDKSAADRHEQSWPAIFSELDAKLTPS